jgi:hypothetical protein
MSEFGCASHPLRWSFSPHIIQIEPPRPDKAFEELGVVRLAGRACPHRNCYADDRTGLAPRQSDAGGRHRRVLQQPGRHQLEGGDQERGLSAAHWSDQPESTLLVRALLHVVQHPAQRLLVDLFRIGVLVVSRDRRMSCVLEEREPLLPSGRPLGIAGQPPRGAAESTSGGEATLAPVSGVGRVRGRRLSLTGR